jgi:hypothetical protein
MPYQIIPFDSGYKVVSINGHSLSNRPLSYENALRQMRAVGIKEKLYGGNISKDFLAQLENIGFKPSKYLQIARKTAHKNGYNPSSINFSDNGVHKLEIIDNNGKVKKFGRVGYGDFIIYSFLEKNKQVPKGLSAQKRNTFQASHSKIKGNWKSNPFSPNNLALRILW